MTVGSCTQLWSFCQYALISLVQGFMVKASRTLVLETANTHILVVSKSTHTLAELLHEPLAALKSVALDVFCCSNLKSMYFITVLRFYI